MLLIDTLMLIRRTYARMDFLKTKAGRPTGMEFGTLRTLEILQKKYPDQEVVLCLDSQRSYRREKYLHYKANRTRVLDEDYYERLRRLHQFLSMNYRVAEKEGYEADDVMHTLSRTQEGSHCIYTNDHNLLQSVSRESRVVVLRSFKSKLFTWDEDKVLKEYGLSPVFLPEYQAFIGDKVDNIVGVPRIIRKFLVDLINWAHTNDLSHRQMLAEIRSAEWPTKLKRRVEAFIDEGTWEMNYELIKLKVLPGIKVFAPTPNDEYVIEKLREWEIYSLELSRKYNIIGNEEF